jgi:hypothetical protein
VSARYMEDPFYTSLRFFTLSYRGLHLEIDLHILSLLQEFHKKLDVFHLSFGARVLLVTASLLKTRHFFLQEFYKK